MFKWLPTYDDVDLLIKKLVEVELLNKDLCKNETSNICKSK